MPGQRSKNIEDRREPVPPVSSPDSLVRGMPQTHSEWLVYQEMLRRRQAYMNGEPPAYRQEIIRAPEPSNGDPAALEAARAKHLEYLKWLDQVNEQDRLRALARFRARSQ